MLIQYHPKDLKIVLEHALIVINNGGLTRCHDAYDCSEELKAAIESLSNVARTELAMRQLERIREICGSAMNHAYANGLTLAEERAGAALDDIDEAIRALEIT